MRIPILLRLNHLTQWKLLSLVALVVIAPSARAGLALNLDLSLFTANGTNYTYLIGCGLSTNFTLPLAPFGGYTIGSPGYPGNYGTGDTYDFDTNGFNIQNGFSVFYGDYDSASAGMTNGLWTIAFSAPDTSDSTNYQFRVTTPNLTSNSLPATVVLYPLDGTTNVSQYPVFTWSGPTNFNYVTVQLQNSDGSYNLSSNLPPNQTRWEPPGTVPYGSYTFTPNFVTNGTAFLTAIVPTNGAGQAISSWTTTCQLQSSFTVGFTVPSPFTPPSGGHVLVARYTWDGTNTDPLADSIDVTGNGSTLNFGGGSGNEGGVTLTSDAIEGNQAVQFHDGDGGSLGWLGVTSPAPALWTLQGSFSVSCWIKTTQTWGNNDDPAYDGAGIITADVNGQANDVIPMALTGGNIGFNTGGNSDDTLNSQTSINDGNYHHVVVTRDQVSGLKTIYIDGQLDTNDFGSTVLLDAPQKLTLGCQADAGDPNLNDFNEYNGFDGKVDDLQIYSGILNPTEVAYLFHNRGATAPILPINGLVAHYAFDNTNFVGADTSGDGYDLDFNGNPNGNGVMSTNDAVAGGGAAYFDGGSFLSYSAIPTNVLAALAGDLTVSVWLQSTQDYGNDGDPAYFDPGIVAADVPGPANDIIPIALTGGDIGFNTGGANDDTVSSSGDINDGQYHQVVITRTRATGEKRIYIDGVFNNSDFATTNLLNAPQIMAVGAQIDASQSEPTNANTGPYYQGLLDDLQIYSRVLSPDEITSLYNNPGSVATSLDLNFNAALGTTNLNYTTSGNADWFVETTNTFGGTTAAQSGSITGEQESTLALTVTGPGVISFDWATSPNGNNFNLAFELDGATLENIGPGSAWSADRPFNISAGQHVLTWVASANGDTDPNEAGFLAAVNFTADLIPIITENPLSQTNYPGEAVGLLAAASSAAPLTWQWYEAGPGLIANATNSFFSPTNSGTAGVAGNYYVVASNSSGSVTSLTATVTFVSTPLPARWATAFRSPFYPDNGGPFTDYNGGCVADASGNVYVANQYIGNITVENSSAATIDTFTTVGVNGGAALIKYNNTNVPLNSAPIAWIIGLTNDDPASFSYADCVALAPGNGVYLGSILSGTNWLGTNRFANAVGYSLLLSRFDASGSNLWSRLLGTNGTVFLDGYNDMVADAAGNLTVAGILNGIADFGGTNLTSPGYTGFLAQYNASGALRWVETLSGFPENMAEGNGQIYVSIGAGVSGGTTNAGVGAFSVVTDRAHGVAAVNATNGQPLWVVGAGEPFGVGGPQDSPLIAVAGSDVFVTGTAYGSPANFGGLSVAIPGEQGQYFARYDTNGNAQVATSFGSATTMPWVATANASGVYVAGDFDNYSAFDGLFIAAPATVPSYLGTNYFTQPFVAKFDRNGNPLWALNGVSPVLGNFRGLAIITNGVWVSGFVDVTTGANGDIVPALFGTNQVISDFQLVGSPVGSFVFSRGGVVAKITETAAAAAIPVALLNPQAAGASFGFQFLSQSGFTHTVQYNTNLVTGTGWQTYTNFPGDGTLKTIGIPLSIFAPSSQGFVRVSTQ
jgi:hypothetical protein